jgi:multiple sugar transport system substrate-binding protein
MAPATGATWFTGDGKSNIAGDPAWQELIKWQKDLVDWYGYKNLAEFTAGLGDEFSADHAFHKGQVADDARRRVARGLPARPGARRRVRHRRRCRWPIPRPTGTEPGT